VGPWIASLAAASALVGWRVGCGGGASRAVPARASAPRPAPTTLVHPVASGEVCTTRGAPRPLASGRLRSTDATARGVAPGTSGDVAELRFAYRGPTDETAQLASGRVQRQVSLKLRAQDGCNLVYVSWRIEPDPGITVKVKSNPGERVNEECGNRGYRTVKPSFARPPRRIARDRAHRLHAEIDGRWLSVRADGALVWQGDLGRAATRMSGPAGFRFDNAAVDFQLLTERRPAARASAAAPPPRCKDLKDG